LLEDTILIEKLKKGDSSAFNELVSVYRNRVINTCYRFLLVEEDAEDVSQEVFIEVYKSIKSFRSDSKLSTWILRIAVSKSLDEIKKRQRKKRISSVFKKVHLEDLANWLVGGPSPEKQLSEKENMKEIMKAMDALPDNQRIAFTLSKVEGYTNPEIAEIMKTTTTAVESLLYRAKKELIRALEDILKNA
jgi:RNA polymerase sigma-70 factor (ECF subfamily)